MSVCKSMNKMTNDIIKLNFHDLYINKEMNLKWRINKKEEEKEEKEEMKSFYCSKSVTSY